MPKKLLSLLAEEITEQGFGRYFRDAILPSGQRIGDVRSVDLSTGKPIDITIRNTELLSNKVKDNEESDNEETYGFELGKAFPGCVGQGKVCYGGINGNWAGSMTRALQMAFWLKGLNFTPGSQKRHTKNATSGNPSNHWKGSTGAYGVDLPCGKKKGDEGWKKLRDEFVSRGWISKDKMPDKYLESGEGKWINFYVGNYKYQVGWNVSEHYDHIHVGVRCLDTSKVNITNPFDDKITIDKKDKEEIKKDNKSGLIYDSLPTDVKKAIDKLNTDWGVEITDEHLKKEINQEGKTVADAGGVNNKANRQINKLIKDCKKQFKKITTDMVSGYRSYNDQVKNFGKKVKNEGRTIDDVQSYNTIPGFSQHHTGMAFDIFSTEPSWWNTNSDVKKWVEDNANSYGFEITYKTDSNLRKKEPWHLFYTDIDVKEEDDVLNSEGLSDGKTVVFGGIGYATPEWMKSQWVDAGLSSDSAVFLSYTSGELSTVKKNNKIDKIVGFSAGGSKVWDEIINNSSDYKFIGLIDPSTSEFQFEIYKDGGLPSVVKSLSNYSNWNDYPNTKKRLKYLEDKNVLTKTNLGHKSIPLEFFKKYKKELS